MENVVRRNKSPISSTTECELEGGVGERKMLFAAINPVLVLVFICGSDGSSVEGE